GEYEQAEKKLQELEVMMVSDYPRNRQYLLEKKATLAYRQRRITAPEYLGSLKAALCCTVPALDGMDLAGWPFNQDEFDILSGIAIACHDMGEKGKELDFLLRWKKNVEREYMDWDHYAVWHTHVLAWLSQLMCLSARHEQSLEYCGIGLEECRKWRILGNVYCFLYDIAWNRENQRRKGDIPNEASNKEQVQSRKKERAFCKKQLVQAYFLSVSQGDLQEAERVKRLYEYFYPEAVKLP
ncbi:MAG: hypothetical protein K2N94_10150, partial [Lachnospiraceae bacterium]|nr:hypothetical protein [Lachnospiraceae bacterium]